MFDFVFTFMAITAMTINLMFIGSWNDLLGESADSFFSSFVNSLVFVTSSENYEDFGE